MITQIFTLPLAADEGGLVMMFQVNVIKEYLSQRTRWAETIYWEITHDI